MKSKSEDYLNYDNISEKLKQAQPNIWGCWTHWNNEVENGDEDLGVRIMVAKGKRSLRDFLVELTLLVLWLKFGGKMC